MPGSCCSAKYGFIVLDFSNPEGYEVSFKYPATGPITVDRLRQQVQEQQLDRYPVIVGQGSQSAVTGPRALSFALSGGR
jgi:tryptophanase